MSMRSYDLYMRRQMLIQRIKNDIPISVAYALKEDLDGYVDSNRDITSQVLSQNKQVYAQIITHEAGIFCGKEWVEEILIQLGSQNIFCTWYVNDGQAIVPNELLCEIKGVARLLLTAERTILNFIQTLSGTASTVNRYVKLLENSKTKILDTRKTLPGLRTALKYAVLCGGGYNHRLGLSDAILIKENHIISSGSISKVVKKVSDLYPELPIEIEVESLEELIQAINTTADIILLDNFNINDIYKAVKITNKRALLEVSGNINEESIKQIGKTNVDYISIGTLTKNIQTLDLSMRFQKNKY